MLTTLLLAAVLSVSDNAADRKLAYESLEGFRHSTVDLRDTVKVYAADAPFEAARVNRILDEIDPLLDTYEKRLLIENINEPMSSDDHADLARLKSLWSECVEAAGAYQKAVALKRPGQPQSPGSGNQ